MHKLIATSTILEHELSELRLLVERQTGVVLDCPNSALAAHVADFIEAQGLGSSTTLLERLRSSEQDPSSLPSLLDGLVNANTGFFRHPGALNALTRQVFPQLCARKSADGPGPIRIWSAGCATGEETYSIAMAVCDAMNPQARMPRITQTARMETATATESPRRRATEASPTVRANCIRLREPELRMLDSHRRQRLAAAQHRSRGSRRVSAVGAGGPAARHDPQLFFEDRFAHPLTGGSERKLQDDTESDGLTQIQNSTRNGAAIRSQTAPATRHLLVKPRLRSLVTFNCMNLARPGYIGRFDCIFCMDVLPHFSRAQTIALLERLHLYLEPGGYLFLSQTEKLFASNLNFRSETFDGYTFHRKPLAASAAYGR